MESLSDYKWLLLPLYPFILILFFGFWLWIRAKQASFVDVKVGLLGMKVEIRIDRRAHERSEKDDSS